VSSIDLQAESFQHALEMPLISPDPFTAVFIRAPVMHSILPNAKPPVEVVATVPFECLPVPVDRFAARDGTTVIPAVPLGKDANICMARQGGLFISSFHPELGGDNRVHEWFVKTMVIPNSEA
jgi:5'-phosphate synthase pdxT subunit